VHPAQVTGHTDMPLTLARLAMTGENHITTRGCPATPGRLALLGAGIHTVIIPVGRALTSRETLSRSGNGKHQRCPSIDNVRHHALITRQSAERMGEWATGPSLA
jgi:hypothetical protein